MKTRIKCSLLLNPQPKAFDFTVLSVISSQWQAINAVMMVGGTEKPIEDEGTAPVIVNERTLEPIRAIIEAMGGSVDWSGDTRTVTLNYETGEIRLVIDNTTAYLNGEAKELDTAPMYIPSLRAMILTERR